MIYIPFVYFILLFLFFWKKQHTFNVGSAITLLYVISSLFAIIMYTNGIGDFTYNRKIELGVVPTVLYCSLITVSILPFYKLRSDKIKAIEEVNLSFFNKVSYMLIIISIINIIMSFNDIKDALTGDLRLLRNAHYETMTDTVSGKQTWYKYILSLIPQFSPILLGFFFYSLIYTKNRTCFNILLLISSLSIVAVSILNASRTQTIYWILTFIIIYVFFHPQMNDKIKKWINILLAIIGIVFVFYIMLVTFSRFGEGEDASNSLIFYIGQPYVKFCQLYNHYTFDGIVLDRLLPITSKYILGHGTFNIPLYRELVEARIHMNIGVFYTFLGDAMVDFGVLGMILYVIVFYKISNKILRLKHKEIMSLSQLIYFILLVRVPVLGLFAFMYLNISTSFLIIGSICLAYLIKNYGK